MDSLAFPGFSKKIFIKKQGKKVDFFVGRARKVSEPMPAATASGGGGEKYAIDFKTKQQHVAYTKEFPKKGVFFYGRLLSSGELCLLLKRGTLY